MKEIIMKEIIRKIIIKKLLENGCFLVDHMNFKHV